MQEKLSLALSDGLFELRRSFAATFPSGGMVLDDEQTDQLVTLLKEFGAMARRLENEVSRSRWNEPALRDRIAEAEKILAETKRPGSNVALFPVVPRPFQDGNPDGRA